MNSLIFEFIYNFSDKFRKSVMRTCWCLIGVDFSQTKNLEQSSGILNFHSILVNGEITKACCSGRSVRLSGMVQDSQRQVLQEKQLKLKYDTSRWILKHYLVTFIPKQNRTARLKFKLNFKLMVNCEDEKPKEIKVECRWTKSKMMHWDMKRGQYTLMLELGSGFPVKGRFQFGPGSAINSIVLCARAY